MAAQNAEAGEIPLYLKERKNGTLKHEEMLTEVAVESVLER
jgi:hypothetical protein